MMKESSLEIEGFLPQPPASSPSASRPNIRSPFRPRIGYRHRSTPSRLARIFTLILRRCLGTASRIQACVAALCTLGFLVLTKNILDEKKIASSLDEYNVESKPSGSRDGTTFPVHAKITFSPTLTPHVTDAPTVSPEQLSSVKDSIKNYNNLLPANGTTWLEAALKEFDRDNTLPIDTSFTGASAKPQHFTDRWCDLTGTNWIPKKNNHKESWQLRAPAVLLPGAKYAGTSSVARWLQQRSNVIKQDSVEMGFFFDAPFRKYVSMIEQKTKVLPARQRMHHAHYAVSKLKQFNDTVTIDGTSGYLLYSTVIPRRILCVMPWVKLVIVLRHPVDRVLAHYQALRQTRGLRISLEDWLDHEFHLLDQAGVTDDAIARSQTTNHTVEDVAWYKYVSSTLTGGVGRSIYVIQLRQWFQALQAAGFTPREKVLIVQAERADSNRILAFLKWPPNDSTVPPLRIPLSVPAATNAATIQRLEDFFQPYTLRLAELLRNYQMSIQ